MKLTESRSKKSTRLAWLMPPIEHKAAGQAARSVRALRSLGVQAIDC
jgi:hypothetical protein